MKINNNGSSVRVTVSVRNKRAIQTPTILNMLFEFCPLRTWCLYQFMDQGSRQQPASLNIWVYTHVVYETFACKGQFLTNGQFTRGYASIRKSAAC